MRYRPEIDGLRAVAVLPVILFHAGFGSFAGGFVGVDVFFVISGYLITSIILADMDEGKFRISTFYERRARRILPALFLVMAACIPFAFMWLLPRDLKDFFQSIVAVSTFSSNILFWRESGYFDVAAELKPLLHTWSLAVEEQYYIFFPLFLIVMWRLGKRWIMLAFVILAIMSLALAQWLVYRDAAAAFFLLPTRVWELLFGALVALYFNRNGDARFDPRVSQVLSLVGLGLITFSVFAFSEETPFPSLYALAPTVGAVLIILFTQPGTLVSAILGHRLVVGIGLISYSAYLWHQPLLAFARHRSISAPSPVEMGILCLVTIPIAYLTWRYVESPFRNKKRVSRRFIFASSGVVAACFIAIGLLGHLKNGYESFWLRQQSASVQKTYGLIKAAADLENQQDNHDCRFNVPSLGQSERSRIDACYQKYGRGVAVLGDSHAIDLFGVVTTSNERVPFIVGITRVHCRPHTPTPGCQYDNFLQYVTKNPSVFKEVIFEQAGFYLLKTDKELANRKTFTNIPLWEPVEGIYPNMEFIKAVSEYLQKIAKYVPVTWFGPRVEPHISAEYIVHQGCDAKFALRKNQYDVFNTLDSAIAKTVAGSDIKFVSQNDAFRIQFPEDLISCDGSYWSDGDHLSSLGEVKFGQRYNLLQQVPTHQVANDSVQPSKVP